MASDEKIFLMVQRAILTVTSAAAKRLKDLMSKKADPSFIGVKVGLARKGCENLSYTMDYAKEASKFDEVVEVEKDIKVIVDKQAVMYLIGSVMDFKTSDISNEFTFNNPNSKSSCGCGKSFSV